MRSVSAYSAGRAFGSGFEGGLRSAIQTAVSTAASLARQALSIVKSTLGIHSPSRETRKLGEYFGQGFELGVKDETKNAAKVVGDFARSAAEAMVMPDFSFDVALDNIQLAIRELDAAVMLRSNIAIQEAEFNHDRTESMNNPIKKMIDTIENAFDKNNTNASGEIHIHVDLDGEQIAEASVPFVNRKLGKQIKLEERWI